MTLDLGGEVKSWEMGVARRPLLFKAEPFLPSNHSFRLCQARPTHHLFSIDFTTTLHA